LVQSQRFYYKQSKLSCLRPYNCKLTEEIYPTKPGGREWFINMADPQADKLFDPDALIQKEADGSWRIGQTADGNDEDHVRIKVTTPEGQPEWKNVEITGYVKALWADSPTDHIDWYARAAEA
jgi:hypothetical protein